jgi:hypothetical protein
MWRVLPAIAAVYLCGAETSTPRRIAVHHGLVTAIARGRVTRTRDDRIIGGSEAFRQAFALTCTSPAR